VRGEDDAILTGTHAGRIAALSDYALGEAACHDVVVVPWRRRSSSNSATCRRPDVVRSTAGSSARACLLQHLTHSLDLHEHESQASSPAAEVAACRAAGVLLPLLGGGAGESSRTALPRRSR
jgi:hypothetical protein